MGIYDGLPFGQGSWQVWGVPATEREDNTGLPSTAQSTAGQEVLVYLTDDEVEARKLVREGGFNRNNRFYATTRVVNGAAEANKQNIAQKSGMHIKRDPSLKRIP